MRILLVSHSFPPPEAPLANLGGMQRVAVELCRALEADARVELDTLVLRSSWRALAVRAVPFLGSLCWRIPRTVRARGIQAVLFSSITTALPAALIDRLIRTRGARVAAIAHGLDVTSPHSAYQLAVRRTLAALDLVLPISRATAEACRERGVPDARVRIVPNAVDGSRFVAPGAPPPWPPPPPDAFVLVSVGRQVRRKGFAWFIAEVLPRLDRRFHYWLAGDGPEREAIEAAIGRAGVADRVRLLGVVSEDALKSLYRVGQLFVMPNIPVPGDMEGFGLVMLEAGASGMPALAADLEGIRDVVTEGVNGHLVASGDAAGFAARILALASDRTRLRALSESTLEHVTARFTWQAVVDRLLPILAGDA